MKICRLVSYHLEFVSFPILFPDYSKLHYTTVAQLHKYICVCDSNFFFIWIVNS